MLKLVPSKKSTEKSNFALIEKDSLNQAEKIGNQQKSNYYVQNMQKTSLLTLPQSAVLEELDLLLLQEAGFIKEDEGKHLILLDISDLILDGHHSMMLDSRINVVRIEEDLKKEKELKVIEDKYQKTIAQLEELVGVLNKLEEKSSEKVDANKEFLSLKNQIKHLKETNEILQIELKEQKLQGDRLEAMWKDKVAKSKKQLTVEKENHLQTKSKLEELTQINDQLKNKIIRLENDMFELKSEVSDCQKRSIRSPQLPLDKIWLSTSLLSTNGSNKVNKVDTNSGSSSPKQSVGLFKSFEPDSPLDNLTPQINLLLVDRNRLSRSHRSEYDGKEKIKKDLF